MSAEEEFRVLMGELGARADTCGLSDEDMRLLIGCWPLPTRPALLHETRARRLYELLGLARWLLVDEAAMWLRSPLRALSGRAPLDVMVRDPSMIAVIRDRLRTEVGAF